MILALVYSYIYKVDQASATIEPGQTLSPLQYFARNGYWNNTHLFNGTVNGLHNDTGDLVRVGIGGGTSVLEVTVALGGNLTGNTDGCATVGDTICELVDGTSLVPSGKTELVALAVNENV